MKKIGQCTFMVENTNKNALTEVNLDTLQWAKEFMERYERKHDTNK